MKKIIMKITVFLLCLFLFSACSVKKSDKKIVAERVIECFNNNDVNGLKEMFCKEIQDSHNLDEEISLIFEYLDGKIVDYEVHNGSEGQSVEEGKIAKEEYGIQIRNVKTDTQRKYIIAYAYRTVDIDNPDKVGISIISIKSYDGDNINTSSEICAGNNV